MLNGPLKHFVECEKCGLQLQIYPRRMSPRNVYDFGEEILIPLLSQDWWCLDCSTVSEVEKIPSRDEINKLVEDYEREFNDLEALETYGGNADITSLKAFYQCAIKNQDTWAQWASNRDQARCLRCGCQQLIPLDQEVLYGEGNLDLAHPGCGGQLRTRTELAPRPRRDLVPPISFVRFEASGLEQYDYKKRLESAFPTLFPIVARVIATTITQHLSPTDRGRDVVDPADHDDNARLATLTRNFVSEELEGDLSFKSSICIKSEFPEVYPNLCLYIRQEIAKARHRQGSANSSSPQKNVTALGSKQTSLHGNPFYLLGVASRDRRPRIIERADECSLHIDHDLCQKARSELINPRTRLAVEMAWMPGVAPRMAEKLTAALSEVPISIRAEGGLPDLARANLMAAAFELVKDDEPAESIAKIMRDFAWLVEYIDAEEVLRDINADRAVAGFPEIKGVETIEEELAQRRKAYRAVLKGLLDSMEPKKLVDTMTDTVAVATDGGESQGPALIDELVDAYEIEAQGFLQKEYENIVKLVESARKAAPRGAAVVAPILDRLDKVAKNWDRVAQPIQLSAKSRGIVHRTSHDVANELRSLGIELNNEHGMLEQAHKMTELLQEIFAELPEVAEKLGEDAEAIKELRQQAQEKEKNKAKWEREITFHAEVGVMFKDELSISPDGIRWKGTLYPLEEITRVRWGGVRNSVNGIPTGTDYTIGFGDNRTEQAIQLKKESTYAGFVDALWKGVCVRMMFDIVQALEEGRAFGLGDMIVEDGAVTLIKHKFLGSNEKVRLPWQYVHVWSGNGSFFIGKKDDKKIYGSSSYVTNWNTHLLEHIIRGGFKKGVLKLSDYLKG